MANPQLQVAASAALLLADRRAADPLFQWAPTPKQAQFLASTKPECWFVAANRAGKSDVAAAWTASMARFGRGDPGVSFAAGGRVQLTDRAVSLWVVSLTHEMGRDICQPKLFDNGYVPAGQPHKPFIPDYEILSWNKTDSVLKLKNGSLVGFKSADQGRERFQGTGKDGVVFDEVPPYSIFQECVIRVEGGRQLWIRGACTLLPPEGVSGGVSWLYAEKLQPWKAGERPQDLELISASIYENPHILPREIERLEALYPPGSIDRRIRLMGEWLPDLAGARAYPAFDRRIHINPTLTAESREWRNPILFAFDSNVEPMGATLWQQIGRRYRCFDEITLPVGTPSDMGREVRRRITGHGAPFLIYGDATATHRKAQTAKSDYELLLDELNALPMPVEICVPQKNPPIRDRINAVNFLLRGHGSESRIEIAPHCVELIDDLEQVRRARDGTIQKSRNPRDPYYKRTAWSDGLGYLACQRDPVMAGDSYYGGGNGSPFGKRLVMPMPGYRFGR